MKEKLIIVGMNTTASHLYEFIKDYDLYDVIGFAVNEKYRDKDTFCDLPVYALETLEDVIDKNVVKVFVAILWNRLNADRRKVYEELKEKGYTFANVISPTAIVRGKILGDNCWVHDYAIIQAGATIGNNNMLMAHSLVGPNTKVGSHCFMGAKSTLAGGCIVGDQNFIGINCTVFDATTVGTKCILGACSVVKRNVSDFSIVKTDVNNMIVRAMKEDEIENKLLHKENVR